MSKFKKVIEYLFYLFIFLLPWQTRLIYKQGSLNGGYWEYGSFSLYGTEILLGIILILVISLFLLQIKRIKIRKRIDWLDGIILVWLVYSAVSLFWSIDKAVSGNYLILFIEALAVFYLARGLNLSFNKISISFVSAGVVQSVLAIYQFLTQSVFANKWLGISDQLVGQAGVSVVEGAGRWLRAYGSLSHPNMLGGFLAICLLFLIGLLFNYFKNFYNLPWKVSGKFIGQAVLLFGSLVLISYGLLLTFSRSAWLGAIVALIVIWLILLWQKKVRLLKFFLKINIVIILVIVFFVANYNSLLSERLSGDSRLQIQSIEERQAGYQESLQIINNKFWFGSGLGNYTTALYELDDSRPAWAYQPVHNVDLLVMAELGIIGWLIMTILIVYILYLIYKKLRLGGNWESFAWLILIPAFFALLVIGIFDHYLWSLYFGLIFSFLIIGLLIRQVE